MPKQDFADGQDSLSISGQRMTLAFPVSMSDEGGIWLATTSIDHVAMSSNRLLPDSGIPIPDDLWNITFGGMHFRTLSNGWETGGILTFGSASDKPFEETRDFTATALGFVTIPARANNAWKLSLFYSPTAQLNFPLPGFAYVWRPNPVWEWNLGLPFSVSYKPNDFFSANASYVPLTNFNACATWQWSPLWSTFASYAITNETYWLTARTDDDDRFFLFDQRLAIGVRRQLARGFALEFSTAYIFDRTIFQGAGFSDRYDELDIDPGVAGILQLSWNR